MDNIIEIKRHIKRISDTEKVTHAMYLISSAKYRKAKEKTISFLPFFHALEEQISTIAGDIDADKCPYVREGKGPDACLVITSDKGLAGDYNKNVLKIACEHLESHRNCRLYVIGGKGKKRFEDLNFEYELIENAEFGAKSSELSEMLYRMFSEKFLSGEIGRLNIIFYGTYDGIRCAPVNKQIFPISINNLKGTSGYNKFEYIPDEDSVINKLIPLYIESCFHFVFIQSFFSEQNLRMAAMDSANSNAGDMLSELNLQYNHMRQNAITQEISEISGERNN
jgi:F-type H+-transporting ATPase subunit gamma